MEESKAPLTQLQFMILDGLVDDYEDVEQLYIFANRRLDEEQRVGIQFPNMLLHVRYPIRELIDEIGYMLQEGYIEVKHSNDEQLAPLRPPTLTLLHHYWFGVTTKGHVAWKAHSAD